MTGGLTIIIIDNYMKREQPHDDKSMAFFILVDEKRELVVVVVCSLAFRVCMRASKEVSYARPITR